MLPDGNFQACCPLGQSDYSIKSPNIGVIAGSSGNFQKGMSCSFIDTQSVGKDVNGSQAEQCAIILAYVAVVFDPEFNEAGHVHQFDMHM